jgi:hypothetical protein
MALIDTGRKLRILLTEGSSLSARQTLYALGPLRHVIDVCDPKPWLCLARYSRYTHTIHRCPPFATDPGGYLRLLLELLRSGRYDVVLPVHDQVFLLSRYRDELRRYAGLAVPEFAALERLQSKVRLVRVLDELKLPYPETVVVRSRKELEQPHPMPCYVKLAHSTAGRGVWRVESAPQLRELAERLEREGQLDGNAVLVQQPARGVFSVVQSVFQHGRLLAAHCYQARAQGVGGSAWARVGVRHPVVLEHLQRLGTQLRWHGALMFDYFFDTATGRPEYIDANPRIGETFNATLSGVNLCDLLLKVSLDQPVDPPRGREGVRTHSLLMSLLGQAEATAGRGAIVAELGRALLRRGNYRDSQDELTRPRQDVFSLLPAVQVVGRLLFHPRSAGRIIGGAVSNYALTETTVRMIRELPATLAPLVSHAVPHSCSPSV